MAIIDKTKAVVENFKEEFSVNGAIELIEGLGYKVYKDFPVVEAKKVLAEKGYTILSEAEIEKMDKLVTEKVEEALSLEKAMEMVSESGYTILSEKQLDAIDKKLEAKIEETKKEALKEALKEAKINVLEGIEQNEEVIEKEFIESLKEKGYTILDEEEAKLVDEEMKKIIEEEVEGRLREEKNIEDPEKDPEGDDNSDNLVDDIKGIENKDKPKKDENVLVKRRKRSLLEKLVPTKSIKEDTEEEEIADPVAGVARNVANGETDLTGSVPSDVVDVAKNVADGNTVGSGNEITDIADEIEDGEVAESTKKKMKKLKLENLIKGH